MVLSVPSMHLSDSSGADAASRRLNMDRWGRALRRKPIVGSILSLFVLIIVERGALLPGGKNMIDLHSCFSHSLSILLFLLDHFSTGLEGFRQIGSFIVVCEQLIVCVQYIKSCLIVDVMSKRRRHV